MKISVKDLKEIANILLSNYEDAGVTSFDVPQEFYWHIPNDAKYDEYEEPRTFTLGQLSEDWEHLHRILKKEEMPIGYAMVWLASILRAIGEKNS